MAYADSQSDGPMTSLAFFKRKAGLTQEQFLDHWENVHGPLVKPWAEKHGFISYTQVHLKSDLNNAAPVGPQTEDANPLADFDGCAIIQVKSFDQFKTAFADEYYIKNIQPDEHNFLDKKLGVLRARGEAKKIVQLLAS